MDDPYKAFNEIWDHRQELQNRYSSSWWFFLLIPWEGERYGPTQMMFTFASKMGRAVGVLDQWQRGMRTRERRDPDTFPTQVAGWIFDGTQLHKNIVFTRALAKLSSSQRFCRAWNPDSHEKIGGSLSQSMEYPIGIDATFIGENGRAEFTTYGENETDELEMPQIVSWMGPQHGTWGNIHTVAWRRFKFKGTFQYDGKTDLKQGIGYFQRVLMNIPLLPWQWNYTTFANGNVFSSFMMYSSLNIFRHKFHPLPPILEHRRFHIIPSAYYYETDEQKVTYFDTARIIPDLGPKQVIHGFFISAKADTAWIKFYVKVLNHTNFDLKRKLFLNYHSTYTWTEYIVEVERVMGTIDVRKINNNSVKHGFGNVEYSMGMSL